MTASGGLERRHRRRICQMGQRNGRRAWHRRLYSQGDRGRRLPAHRARRRRDVDLRHLLNRFFWRPLSRFAERRLQLLRGSRCSIARLKTHSRGQERQPELSHRRGRSRRAGARQCFADADRGRNRRPARPFRLRQVLACCVSSPGSTGRPPAKCISGEPVTDRSTGSPWCSRAPRCFPGFRCSPMSSSACAPRKCPRRKRARGR